MSVLSRLLKRFARKSQTFRRVYAMGGGHPEWSRQDAADFAREGYAGNPYMRAALDFLAGGSTQAPPLLYRVGSGSKIEKQYKSAYNLESALQGFSARHYSLNAVASRTIGTVAAGYMAKGIPGYAARRMAVKALSVEGELEQITSHPALDLLARPNGYTQTNYSEFVTAHMLSLLLSGETFTEPIGTRGELGAPTELYIVPAHEIEAERAVIGNPLPGFRHTSQRDVKWRYSPDPAVSELFFAKLYDPVNPVRGLSPIEAALRSIDLNNEARAYNLGFMRNAGVPPMLITGEFDEAEGAALREGYAQEVGGSANAGRIITISGRDLKTTQLSIDAAKLLWGEVLSLSAKEIGIVFGVPEEILGGGASRTFANYAEARLSAYQDKIIPSMDAMYRHWNTTWLTRFGPGLMLDYDSDQIPAMQEATAKRYEYLKGADWISHNEKRTATGYEEKEGADSLMVSTALIPLEMSGIDDMPLKDFHADGTGVEDYVRRLPALSGDGQ